MNQSAIKELIFTVIRVSYFYYLNNLDRLAQSMQELPRANRDNGQRVSQNFDQSASGLQIKEDPSRVTVSRMKSSYGEELRKQMEQDQK